MIFLPLSLNLILNLGDSCKNLYRLVANDEERENDPWCISPNQVSIKIQRLFAGPFEIYRPQNRNSNQLLTSVQDYVTSAWSKRSRWILSKQPDGEAVAMTAYIPAVKQSAEQYIAWKSNHGSIAIIAISEQWQINNQMKRNQSQART